jgi:membrane protease YdiL (CAAX protease family)
MSFSLILLGFLILFALYQLAEANGQNLLKFPGKPYTIFLLFLAVIPAAALVARWQGAPGLSAYGMGFEKGWWLLYLFGLVLGIAVRALFEFAGFRLGIRQAKDLHFSWRAFLPGLLWILFANFPAAASEDLLTRGYPWRFMQASPLLGFIIASALIYTLNHLIRLLTRPLIDWYYLPFLGLTLAYALFQTGSLWLVIGLHQSVNVVSYLMQQMVDYTNTPDTKRRLLFGLLTEIVVWAVVILAITVLPPSL